jgi:hypothetical protein
MKHYAAHKFHNNHSRARGKFLTTFSWIRGIFCIAFLLGGSAAVMAETLKLAWDANPEADIAGYKVRYGTTPGNYPSVQDAGNATSATVNNLTPGTTYYFVVTAYSTTALESQNSTELSTTTAPADTDSDGLPDSWESQNGITGGALDDQDKDGLTNLVEYALNLDPKVPQGSSPTATSVQVNPADGKSYLTLTYQRRINSPGVVFNVEATNNLVNWNSDAARFEQIGTPVAAQDGITEVVSIRVKPALGDSADATNMVRLRVKRN